MGLRGFSGLCGAEEGVGFALAGDGGGWAVAGEHFGFIGQGQQAGLDGVDDLAGVAAGQVSAADAAGKESVAGDEQLEWREMEADGALGVAGGVEDLGREGFQADDEAVGEILVGRGGFRGGRAEPAGLSVHYLELGQVVLVHEDGCAGEALELEGAAYVVNVAVGDEDLLELEAELSEAALDAADLFAGIDDDGFAGFLVAEDGAVALEWTDGEGL